MFTEMLTKLIRKAFRVSPKYVTVNAVDLLDAPPMLPSMQMPENMPSHVALIMDGNGRWAVNRGLPRSAGHAAGTEALRDIIRASDEWGIKTLTLYAFSTENWARDKEEVDALMSLLLRYFRSEIDELHEKHVRIRILGDITALPEAQREAVQAAMDKTKDNTGLRLNIAINYGGRAELVRAAKSLAQKVQNGALAPDAIDDKAFADELYTAGQDDVDLLIRTSGEMRLSNFLPWQTTYAEFLFDRTLFPDFTRDVYLRALREYSSRKRLFGGNRTPKEAKQA